MDKKNKLMLFPVILSVAAIALFFGISAELDNVQNISEPTKNLVYIPSDITKAIPNMLVGSGDASISTTNIEDVSDDVIYTIEGTILSIGDPIDWYERDLASSGHGSIPVTMTVENVYKGSLDSETFTFFLGSFIHYDDITLTTTISEVDGKNKTYYLWSFEPQFEIGEKVLVHIYESYVDEKYFVDSDDREIMTPYYIVQLGKYGKYQMQNGVAFNEKFFNGRSISNSIQEAQ